MEGEDGEGDQERSQARAIVLSDLAQLAEKRAKEAGESEGQGNKKGDAVGDRFAEVAALVAPDAAEDQEGEGERGEFALQGKVEAEEPDRTQT